MYAGCLNRKRVEKGATLLLKLLTPITPESTLETVFKIRAPNIPGSHPARFKLELLSADVFHCFETFWVMLTLGFNP